MELNEIVSPAIGPFVAEWVKRGPQAYADGMRISDCLKELEDSGFPRWAKVIFFNDASLRFRVPPTPPFFSPTLSYPFPVFDFDIESIEEAVREISLKKISSFFLHVQKNTETIYDCFERAYKNAERLKKQKPLQYIVAFRVGELSKLTILILDYDGLTRHLQKLSLALTYQQISQQPLPAFATSESHYEAGKLLVFEPCPHDRKILGQYIQLILLNQNIPFVLKITGAILQISDTNEDESNLKIQARRYHGKDIFRDDNSIQWSVPGVNYIGITVKPDSVKNNEAWAGWLGTKILEHRPRLLIWDCMLVPESDTPLDSIFQKMLNSGCDIWLCSHGKSDQLKIDWKEKISIARKSGRNGEQLFISTHTIVGTRPKQYRFSVDPKNELPNSIHADKIRRIRTMSVLGTKEEEIAEELGLSLPMLRQLKRRAGIRVNAPLKQKRRTGMDKRIAALRDILSVEDIARRLKTSPSYIKRRFKAQDEARQKSLFEGSQPPLQ